LSIKKTKRNLLSKLRDLFAKNKKKIFKTKN